MLFRSRLTPWRERHPVDPRAGLSSQTIGLAPHRPRRDRGRRPRRGDRLLRAASSACAACTPRRTRSRAYARRCSPSARRTDGGCLQLLAPLTPDVDDREVPRPQRPGRAAGRVHGGRRRRDLRGAARAGRAAALRRPAAGHRRTPGSTSCTRRTPAASWSNWSSRPRTRATTPEPVRRRRRAPIARPTTSGMRCLRRQRGGHIPDVVVVSGPPTRPRVAPRTRRSGPRKHVGARFGGLVGHLHASADAVFHRSLPALATVQ